jgi:hypothetical protein
LLVHRRVRLTHHYFRSLFPKAYLSRIVFIHPAPIGRVQSLGHKSMKRRIWPIYYSFHITMFHRIPMDIIQVALKIQIVPDEMVPESSLPDAGFAALGRRFLGWSVLSSQIAALAADGSLNDRPTGTEIIIIFRQGPDGMKVIRQQHPGLDGEGQRLPHLLNPLPQGGPDMVVNQKWSASKRDHGKEIAAAFYSDSAVFGHLFWCVRRTLRFVY